MFKALGVVVALYVAYAMIEGAVYAKSGITGRKVLRAESPRYFWAVIVVYAALSMALITIF